MDTQRAVMRADDPRRRELETQGWTTVARSWGAALDSASIDTEVAAALVTRAATCGAAREVQNADVPQILALDALTARDYPGDIATRHEPLTSRTARVGGGRRAFGVFAQGRALAVTYLDLSGHLAEIDFTVVTPELRHRGLGSAVKAASLLALIREGVTAFRTGGSSENTAILAINQRLGFVVDEQWVTLVPPMRP